MMMSTSFKRHDVQEFIEYNLGCTDIENWKNYVPSLKKFIVDAYRQQSLTNCIESDASSYFYKSIYSFVQALSNLYRSNYNWSIVQLYYSCFYAIRADILLSNHCIVRCNGLYIAENAIGKQFEIVQFGKVRGDHQMAIELLKKMKTEHKIVDEILDVDLEGTDAYSWLMKHRERSNYQIKHFSDPEVDELFQHLVKYFETNTLFELFDFYRQSDYTICFDIEHSALSIPFKKIIQVKEKLKTKHGLNLHDNLKHYAYLKKKLLELGITKENLKSFI